MRTPLLLALLGALASCTSPPGPSLERFEFTRIEMGMEFRIVLYAPQPESAALAANAAFDRIHALNALFSDYEDDSELTTLSRSSGTGRAVPLSPELWTVLEHSQKLAQTTQGAFDVTVGPFVSLWRRARRQHELPRPDLMELARQRVGYDKLHLDPAQRTATLTVPRMRLDLGGIAKGYAMDEALEVLEQHGIRSALVSGGGDMILSAPPPGRSGWRVALAPLDAPDAPSPDYLLLAHKAIATSGDLFQYVEIDGQRYSHIVDPRTGLGLTDRSLVTVVANQSVVADSLATAVSVLGPDRGLKLIARYPGVEARLVRRPLAQIEVRETPGFRRWLTDEPSVRPEP